MRTVASFVLLLLIPLIVSAQSLSIFPPTVAIRGADDAPQLLVTLKTPNRDRDRTASAKYQVADGTICRIDENGRIFPIANGTTEIIASVDGLTAKVSVTVSAMETPRPINFANQIEPILTKLSCNSGGCHGKIQGQNGFRLSLLGFDPELDYMTLLKESRGRRLMPTSPDASLFLTKATGRVPHGGGKKLEPDSEEYKILRRWIATGMPYGQPTDPTIQKIVVHPESRVVDRQSRQQLVVHAHYSDGTIEDVTRRTQFESNETEVAVVDGAGLVQSLSMTGQAAIMVRFSGQVTVFRAIVPQQESRAFEFPMRNIVDQKTSQKWRELGLVPSDIASDETFIRRAYLDIAGTLPDATTVRDFVADPSPNKRDRLIDQLVESPEYANFFANKWADVLRVKRRGQPGRATGTFAFHNWIQNAMATDMPYDRFVREIICATGDELKSPPTVWYKEVATAENFVDDLSQVFLGQRMACANCHHHPYEKWSQDDYWGLAAFYGRIGKKPLTTPGRVNDGQNRNQVIYVRSNGSITNKRTNAPAPLKPLDAEPMTVDANDDPRERLADWMADPKNPFFARAVANRYWAHFFGRGIVDPIDDMRITNPPSNPELLDALANSLIESHFSLKTLVKTICKSRTYSLSAVPNEFNRSDKQSFARYYPKRLSAEVVFDAVCKLTDSPSQFAGLPTDKYAPQRAIMLPDESFTSYFLDVFGRPQRISACECERVNEASLAMTLHMLNSQEVQDKIARAGARADRMAKDPRSDDEKITEIFLAAIGRKPSPDQLTMAKSHLEKHAKDKKQAYENIIWALLNTKAFLFNQ